MARRSLLGDRDRESISAAPGYLKTALLLAAALLLAIAVLACERSGDSPTADPEPDPEAFQELVGKAGGGGKLTIYSGRGENLVGPIIEQFSQASGIQVGVKYADTTQLAGTLLEEGRASPADVFFAQDPGGLGAVEDMLAPLPEEILAKVPTWARSPDGKWVGISGRARTVVYNTQKLSEADLPEDMWDFTDPKWKGRIGWAPTNASFQTMVTAMRALWGEEKTREWLEGIQANNPRVYPKNTPIVQAAADGEIDVGFVNHYYLFQFLVEEGDSFPARNYHPRAGGPGAVIMVAGAGILSTAENRDNAERFLEFMLSPVAQQFFASQTFEYPLVEGVTTSRLLVPISEINHPDIALKDLGGLEGTIALLRETGVLP
ncbi:MAG: iron ABC transporter substrate-binding protein [Chloroflexi bacterium]|nr:iron ABC transporter substrate-binding protein [Chloroflexota bacterium]